MAWIRCDDRLPEKDGDYLVWFPLGYAMTLHWCEGWNLYRSCVNGKVDHSKEIKDAIAWQPIEPFEEKENGNEES